MKYYGKITSPKDIATKEYIDTTATQLAQEIDEAVQTTGIEINLIKDSISELDNDKVDKVEGKGLSTNDFTNDAKTQTDFVKDHFYETSTSVVFWNEDTENIAISAQKNIILSPAGAEEGSIYKGRANDDNELMTRVNVDVAINDAIEAAGISDKMDKTNPKGFGSLSINRLDGSTVGNKSAAVGNNTTASGANSSAEGYRSIASGENSHAEGQTTTASGNSAHAEGKSSLASGNFSHAEGQSEASGSYSHGEGTGTASGNYGHAEGSQTQALKEASHAEGLRTVANGSYQHVAGRDNVPDTSSARITGWGTSSAKKNIEQLDRNGNLRLAGDVYAGCNDDSTGGTKLAKATEIPDVSGKMDKTNPVGSGAVSIGRNASLPIGTDSVAIGSNPAAIGVGAISLRTQTMAGTMAFKVMSIDAVNHTITLDAITGLAANQLVSFYVISDDASFDTNYDGLKLLTTIGNVITVDYTNSAIFTDFEPRVVDADNSYMWVVGDNTLGTIQVGSGAYAEGYRTHAQGIGSHAEGIDTVASGRYAHAEGRGSQAIAYSTHAEGRDTKAGGMYAHSEGRDTVASNYNSHAEGVNTEASGNSAHAEGRLAKATEYAAHAEGVSTTASGNASHAEGRSTIASGGAAHAEGNETSASGINSHAEGQLAQATGQASHSEGYSTQSNGIGSHAEGNRANASANGSHAEGNRTIASGENAHAQGRETTASGVNSHAEGIGTIANGAYQHVAGKYNIADNTSLRITGNGTASARSNAEKLDANGNLYLAGKVIANGVTDAGENGVRINNGNVTIVSQNDLLLIPAAGAVSINGHLEIDGVRLTGLQLDQLLALIQ